MLGPHGGGLILPPSIASRFDRCQIERGSDFTLPLEELNTKTHAHMPGNVAMHQPGARVVRLECNHHPSRAGKLCNVSAGGVLKVEAL